MQETNEVKQTEVKDQSPPLVHELDNGARPFPKQILIPITIVVGGILSGFLLSKIWAEPAIPTQQKEGTTTTVGEQKAGGGAMNQVFSDQAEGNLEVNTSKTEGSHTLIRPGGASQTVYLTSSVLDLSAYVGKKVRVWGQTFAAKQAGWLMDVGKVEVLQ